MYLPTFEEELADSFLLVFFLISIFRRNAGRYACVGSLLRQQYFPTECFGSAYLISKGKIASHEYLASSGNLEIFYFTVGHRRIHRATNHPIKFSNYPLLARKCELRYASALHL